MQKSSLENQLAASRLELGHVDELARNLYSNGIEAEALFAKAQNTAVVRLQIDSRGTPTHTTNAAGNVLSEARGHAFADLAQLQALVTALNASDEYNEAKKAVQPIVDSIAKLEAEIESERRAESKARQEREDAKQAAVEKALATIEKDFATA